MCPSAKGMCQSEWGGGGGGRGVQMLLECVRVNGLCPNATGVCHSHRLSWTTGLPPSIFACVKTLLECVRCHWRVGCYSLECTRHHHWSVSDATGVGLSYWISSDATVECRVLLESVRAMSDATGVSGASHWSMPDTITGVRQMPLECVRHQWSMSHSNGIH